MAPANRTATSQSDVESRSAIVAGRPLARSCGSSAETPLFDGVGSGPGGLERSVQKAREHVDIRFSVSIVPVPRQRP